MNAWTTGQWVMFAINLLVVAGGLYLIVFGGRIDARQRAKNEGDEGGGYQSPLSAVSARTQGAILLALGSFGLYRYVISN